jgi:hypothetical protein
VADLRARASRSRASTWANLEATDQIVAVPNNYPSKGTGGVAHSSSIAKVTHSPLAKPPDSGQPNFRTADETGAGSCSCAASGMASFENPPLPRADGAHGDHDRSTADLEASRANRGPACCKHQSSSRAPAGRATPYGQSQQADDRLRPSTGSPGTACRSIRPAEPSKGAPRCRFCARASATPPCSRRWRSG